MMGDSADNIPGLLGVGEKLLKILSGIWNFREFISQHASVKGAMKDKIEANKELGILSVKLATILLDCPVTFDADDFELSKPDVEKRMLCFKN